MSALPRSRMEDWVLRCRFRHSDLTARKSGGQIREDVKSRPASPRYGKPAGTKSEKVTWIDNATDDDVAEFHRFRLPNGKLAASKMNDPKWFIYAGLEHRRLEGEDDTARDVTKALPISGIRPLVLGKIYGFVRRCCCRWFGPEKDIKFAQWLNPKAKVIFLRFGTASSEESASGPL